MDVRKKVMFIVPSMRGGGSERVISLLVSNLNRYYFDITLVLLKKEGPYLKDIPDYINIIDLNAKQARFALLRIMKLISKNRSDIVFSTLGYLNILIAIIRPFFSKKMRFIARESSIVSVQNQQEKYPRLFDFLYKLFYNNFDTIICQSEYMKNDLIKNYKISSGKMVVINNPVDIEKINKESKRSKSLFNKQYINLLAVGGLRPEKGFDLLLNAFSQLDDNYFLTIIGDGKERKKLEQLAKELKTDERVNFLGFQSNPYPYMVQADLVVLSSQYEGFPNIVLEANACGTPVVAFDCPGGTGEIIEDGINGFLVECGDVSQLAEIIQKVSLYGWNTQKIKEFINKKYAINFIIKKYEDILIYDASIYF